MLQKLRSRHPIDVPAEGWERKKGILAVLGGIAVVFLFVPLLLALYGALVSNGRVDVRGAAGIAAAFGFLLLIILVGGIVGKMGADRR